MTLSDAFTAYAGNLHSRTLRPFLGFRVLNAANTNTRAPFSPLPAHGDWAAGLNRSAAHFADFVE